MNKHLLTLQQVMNYLQVSRPTVFRLIKSYKLPAIKIGGLLRFRQNDLEEYLLNHLTIAGLVATKPFLFRKSVLLKYRNNPQKYYLHDETFFGKVGIKKDRYQSNSTNPADSINPKNCFASVFYNRIKLQNKEEVLVVTPAEVKKIPPIELAHWNKFAIQRKVK
jgi:excisionase family DNA binding protein